MPDYRSLPLALRAPATPAADAIPLQGTQLSTLHQALGGLDTLPPSGPRVLFEWGLQGGSSFLIPDAVALGGGSQIYPDAQTPRVVGRLGPVTLTPGHFVGCHLLAIPSGPFAVYNNAQATYDYDGAGGSVRVEVTYENGDADTITVSFELDCPASQLYLAQEPSAAHQAMFTRDGVALPAPLQPSAAEWEKWTRGADVIATVTIYEIGSPRIIDGHLLEVPLQIVVDHANDWPTAIYTHAGAPYAQSPNDYPIEQLTSTDPGGGFNSIRRALEAHGRQFGPFLFGYTFASPHDDVIDDWVSYNTGTGDDEAPPFTVNGTTPTLAPHGATSPSTEHPAWSLGHYGRQVNHGDHFLDGRTGVIPVWVWAYVRVSAGMGTFELRTDDVGWSAITWTTASTSWTGVLTAGWLETGVGPEDDKPVRLWVYNSGANDTSIRYLACWFRP